MPKADYCIIGAGAAGLAALRTLLDEGFTVECFEKTERLGGHWHTDYEALHLITPRDSSAFEDFPMPSDYPLYPSRDQVRDYILAYASAFDLAPHIRLETAVDHIVPLGEHGEAGWRVTLSTGEACTYKGVLVANGHLWEPALPDVAVDFTGQSLHSCQYRNTDDIEGRVLVVGKGNSGCDLAVDAAQHRLDVGIVVRRGQVFQPKTILGKPRSELPFLQNLPPELQNAAANILFMAARGTTTDYPGLPAPETYDLDQQPPVINDQMLHWIHHGRIEVLPAIEWIEGRTVHFTGGRAEDYDTILWATGFNTRLPFLDDDLLEWHKGVPLRTAATVLPTTLEQLYFVGLCAPRGPQWPVYCQQARLIAGMLRTSETGMTNLAARFRAGASPEIRIDIVKREWLADLDRSWSILHALAPCPTNRVA